MSRAATEDYQDVDGSGDRALALASELAAELFGSGSGERAERLVLTSAEGLDLGGWCVGAVRGRILETLRRMERISCAAPCSREAELGT